MSLRSDFRFTLRMWRRFPMVVAIAALSLGLGVGATTTMFSVVNTVAFYELGFEDVDRLVVLWDTAPGTGFNRRAPRWDVAQAVLEHGDAFEELGFTQFGGMPVTLTSPSGASRVSQLPVDGNLLRVLGVEAQLGRVYEQEDFEDVIKQKEARAIVVSHDTWQQRLGGAPDVIGSIIRVDGDPRTVIGVMPEGFTVFPWDPDQAFWAANDLEKVSEAAWMVPVGRLKPGVTPQAAQAAASAIRERYLEEIGEDPGDTSALVEPLHEAMFRDARDGLTFLLGAVSFVLLIACANVANLLLATGTARQKELALRAAVGARRLRLVRQLFAENVLLGLLGGVIGVCLALAGTRLYSLSMPSDLPSLLSDVHVDVRVLAFALTISVASALVFGLVPALRAVRVDLSEALGDRPRGSSGGRSRARTVLLVAEVALSMVLLVGAGLMMRGFLEEQSSLPGFPTERLLTADILLGGTAYFDKTPHDTNLVTPQVESFYDQVLERTRALPGVSDAGIISRLPMQPWRHPFEILGRPVPEVGSEPLADLNEVDAGLFDTLGIQVLMGRGVEEGDVEASPWVAVVNKTFAEQHFPGESPIGQAIRVSMGYPGLGGPIVEEPRPREIVGVVADVTYPSFFEEKIAAVYIPFRQHLWQYAREDEWLHTRKALMVRTAVDPLTLAQAVADVVKQVDPDQTATDIMTMDRRVARSPSVAMSQFFASIFSAFGVMALILAMIGVYGVTSYLVGQRTMEFGIRMALGARARDVVMMLLGQSLRPILLGVVIGVVGGFGLGRALNAMFFRMTGADPVAFLAMAALMIGAAMLAAWYPVRRVTAIDPQQALRHG